MFTFGRYLPFLGNILLQGPRTYVLLSDVTPFKYEICYTVESHFTQRLGSEVSV